MLDDEKYYFVYRSGNGLVKVKDSAYTLNHFFFFVEDTLKISLFICFVLFFLNDTIAWFFFFFFFNIQTEQNTDA